MQTFLLLLLVVLADSDVNGQSLFNRLRNAIVRSHSFPQMFADVVLEVLGKTGDRADSMRNFPIARSFDRFFLCNTLSSRSPNPPNSVHQLKPGDIDIVAAMGDSLVAGNGIISTNILHTFVENRGISFAIGGQGSWSRHHTLPNILKEFNPDLIGYSLSDSTFYNRKSQFSVAFGGAGIDDLLPEAQALVERLHNDPDVNMQYHWKLVTVFIGGNDVCINICYRGDWREAIEDHKKKLMETLDYLQEKLPRTLINLILLPDMLFLRNITHKPIICRLMHVVYCACVTGARADHRLDEIQEVIMGIQKAEMELANSGRYDTKEDFTVVAQPFTANSTIPTVSTPYGDATDYSYFSSDCFHLSEKGHDLSARALWRNMLQPVGRKSTSWSNMPKELLCPSVESPFIFTGKNSKTFLAEMGKTDT